MVKTINASSAADLQSFCALPAGASLHASGLDGEEHLLTVDDGDVQARCSLWWRSTPSHDGQRLGYVGHFAARTAPAALDLLEHACRALAAHDCTLAVGPIDGSTWKRYRLLTERGVEPPFFLEPNNPDVWPAYFSAAGFTTLAHYTSASDDLKKTDPRAPDVAERMHALGVSIRQMDPQCFADEVNRIFDVSLISFQRNFLYTPIERAECLTLYEPLKQFIRPELVFIAEQRGAPVGFIFAIPDWLQAQRGSSITTVVVKTVAILPQREYAGLGGLLLSHCRQRAVDLGYTRAIHALMHDDNTGSRRLSDRFGASVRGYTLFARPLGPVRL